jgi:glucose-1-phosphate cytidylyltransferase
LKAVILAGGFGTRLSEETVVKPKPMVEIGGKPILWHIMKIYSHFGINDFIICLGYKGYMIKEYFANYFIHMSDVMVDVLHNKIEVQKMKAEPWKVTLIDTGDESQTGGRLKRIGQYLNKNESFCFTYGDGVADVDIKKEIAFHKKHGKLATICAVQPPGRYGALVLKGTSVTGFQEKPPGDGAWINGGFLILKPKVLDFIDGDGISFETDTLVKLSQVGQLESFFHGGFWQAMDTLRDKRILEEYWTKGNAPWRVWK